MSQLFPCPHADCEHWNAPESKACWSCKGDLSGVDGTALAARHRARPSRAPVVISGVLALIGLAMIWSFLQSRAVAGDQTPPVLVLEEPATTTVRTGEDEIEIRGRVEDEHASSVVVGKDEIPLEDGVFSTLFEVEDDDSEVTVTAYDKNGNPSEPVVISIAVDFEPPNILAMEPEDGTIAVTRTLVVAGETDEELATVTAAGVPGEIDGMSFRAEVPLAEGGNTVLVTLTDHAGNVTQRSVAVTYQERRLPPGFSSSGRTASGHELFTAAKDGAQLILVPGGSYSRGSDSGDDDEAPARNVQVSAFFIEATPVTNAQYAKFIEATGGRRPAAPDFQSDYFTAVPDGPVVNVSWNEARAYAEWAGRVLPTEAQWELAARGTASGKWPWGNEDGEAGTHFNGKGDADGFAGASPVGRFPAGASPYGAQDMAGNVWEWCADRYSASYFRSAPEVDPPGPSSGSQRSLRGGAYTSGLGDVRTANRYKRSPGDRRPNVGFRTAAVFPQ